MAAGKSVKKASNKSSTPLRENDLVINGNLQKVASALSSEQLSNVMSEISAEDQMLLVLRQELADNHNKISQYSQLQTEVNNVIELLKKAETNISFASKVTKDSFLYNDLPADGNKVENIYLATTKMIEDLSGNVTAEIQRMITSLNQRNADISSSLL